MNTPTNVTQFIEGNFRWLHTCTNGKTLVSPYYLTDYYDKELIGCNREIIEIQPTGNDSELAGVTEYNAIASDGTSRGIFYNHEEH